MRIAPVLLSVLIAMTLAGCGPGGSWIAGLLLLASFAFACNQSRSPNDPDASIDAGGSRDPCCEDGLVTTCFCPAGSVCNFWFTSCGDGTCATIGSPPDTCGDAGPPDAGGTWENCCVDGVITTCFCPAGAACNYGRFVRCGDGSCTDTWPIPTSCLPDAAIELDAGGL